MSRGNDCKRSYGVLVLPVSNFTIELVAVVRTGVPYRINYHQSKNYSVRQVWASQRVTCNAAGVVRLPQMDDSYSDQLSKVSTMASAGAQSYSEITETGRAISSVLSETDS